MIDSINKYVKFSLHSECASTHSKSRRDQATFLFDDLWAQFDPVIIEDPTQFESASKDLLRSHYRSWISQQEDGSHVARSSVCLVINDESLRAFQNMKHARKLTADKELDPAGFLKNLEVLFEYEVFDSFMGGFIE
jgi:hypothetical protein